MYTCLLSRPPPPPCVPIAKHIYGAGILIDSFYSFTVARSVATMQSDKVKLALNEQWQASKAFIYDDSHIIMEILPRLQECISIYSALCELSFLDSELLVYRINIPPHGTIDENR